MPDETHFRELLSGMLSSTTTFRLNVTGPVGVKELGVLIRKLEIDRDALQEDSSELLKPLHSGVVAPRVVAEAEEEQIFHRLMDQIQTHGKTTGFGDNQADSWVFEYGTPGLVPLTVSASKRHHDILGPVQRINAEDLDVYFREECAKRIEFREGNLARLKLLADAVEGFLSRAAKMVRGLGNPLPLEGPGAKMKDAEDASPSLAAVCEMQNDFQKLAWLATNRGKKITQFRYLLGSDWFKGEVEFERYATSPAGPFQVLKVGNTFLVYFRPEAPRGTFGWLKRIDFRSGSTPEDLRKLRLQAERVFGEVTLSPAPDGESFIHMQDEGSGP